MVGEQQLCLPNSQRRLYRPLKSSEMSPLLDDNFESIDLKMIQFFLLFQMVMEHWSLLLPATAIDVTVRR